MRITIFDSSEQRETQLNTDRMISRDWSVPRGSRERTQKERAGFAKKSHRDVKRLFVGGIRMIAETRDNNVGRLVYYKGADVVRYLEAHVREPASVEAVSERRQGPH